MNTPSDIPFSARNTVRQRPEAEFPVSAKRGLLHLLFDLADRGFVESWGAIARELQRIRRLPPVEYDLTRVASLQQAKIDSESALNALTWENAYDFCERLYGHLAKDVGYQGEYGFEIQTPKSEVQKYVGSELHRLFLEEGLAFEFSDGEVRRRGRKHTVEPT